MPKILITGGAGYIGSHVAFCMVQNGYEVIIIDNFLHKQEFDPSWAKLIISDYADAQVLNDVFSSHKIDAVMHLAGSIEVCQSTLDPIKFYNNNVQKSIQLFNAMLKHNVNKLIFSSTCAVYGQPQYLPMNEEHPLNPLSPYAKTKLIIEEILKDLSSAYSFDFVSLRYFNAAGALPDYGLGEQHFPETHIIPILLHSIYTSKPFTIFGNDYPTKDGTCLRDYIHPFDIAQAHYLALKHLQAGHPSDIFNLGTGNGFSVKEIINAVQEVYKIKIQTNIAKNRPGDSHTLIADPTKANVILKWKPKYSDLNFIIRSAYAHEHKAKRFENLQKINL